jgi:serine/threonine-protein kinase
MSSTAGDADRNLLFGVLALQADLIEAAQFAEVCSAWAARKDTPLADLLVERGLLTPSDRVDISKILDRKLKKHQGDASAGLSEVTTDEVRHTLASVADPAVRQTIAATLPSQRPVQLPTTLHVPEVRDRYTLNCLHATGGIGRVWLAHDDRLNRDVALKELRPDRAGHPALAARFLKEARITGQLEHPGIVPVYEIGRHHDNEPPFYTMRFVRGRTLATAVTAYHRRRAEGVAEPMELRHLLAAFVGVCNTVAYAHSRGVLHRDLKPANVVLGDFAEVVVLDWGLARLVDQVESNPDQPPIEADGAGETRQGQVMGTPGYMPPEQAEGRLDQVGPASDVYGLGAILYTILTGQAPFTAGETKTLLDQVVHNEPARPRSVVASVPAALEAVCLKALAKQPAARYASAKELADEVQRFLADEPVGVYREPWPVRAARWARQRRSLVVGTAVFLLSAVVALSVSTVLIWQEQRRTAQQKHEAEQERDRAEKNFEAARQLSLRMITITETKLSPLRQTAPARADLVDAALATFQPVLAARPDDPELQEHLAVLHRYSANGRRFLGEDAVAERSYRESIKLWDKLAASPTATRLQQRLLGETLRDYSMLQKRRGRLRDATDSLRRSAKIAEDLLGSGPAEANIQRLLATTLLDLADVEYTRGLFREARESSRRASSVYRVLLALPREQHGPLDRLFFAAALNRQGMCQRELGQPAEALDWHGQAVKDLRAQLAQKKADMNVMHFLGRSLVEQSRTLTRIPERRAEAEPGLNEAVGLWQDLSGRSPQTPLYREWQGVAFEVRGEWRTTMKRLAPAGEDLDRSRAILEGFVKQSPTNPGYRGLLGRSYGALGRLALARRDAHEAAQWFRKATASLRRAVEQDRENSLHRAALDEFEAEAKRLAP